MQRRGEIQKRFGLRGHKMLEVNLLAHGACQLRLLQHLVRLKHSRTCCHADAISAVRSSCTTCVPMPAPLRLRRIKIQIVHPTCRRPVDALYGRMPSPVNRRRHDGVRAGIVEDRSWRAGLVDPISELQSESAVLSGSFQAVGCDPRCEALLQGRGAVPPKECRARAGKHPLAVCRRQAGSTVGVRRAAPSDSKSPCIAGMEIEAKIEGQPQRRRGIRVQAGSAVVIAETSLPNPSERQSETPAPGKRSTKFPDQAGAGTSRREITLPGELVRSSRSGRIAAHLHMGPVPRLRQILEAEQSEHIDHRQRIGRNRRKGELRPFSSTISASHGRSRSPLGAAGVNSHGKSGESNSIPQR